MTKENTIQTKYKQNAPTKRQILSTKTQFDVPGNGNNCLIHSVAFAYLLPVVWDYSELSKRFEIFFGRKLENYPNVENFLMKFDFSDLNEKINQNENFKLEWFDLIQKSRKEIALNLKPYFEEGILTFISEEEEYLFASTPNEYIEKIGENSTFLGGVEIRVLEEILVNPINSEEERENGERYPSILSDKKGFLIELVRINGNHYNFKLEDQVIDLNKKLKENRKKIENILENIKNIETSPTSNKFIYRLFKLIIKLFNKLFTKNKILNKPLNELLNEQEKLVKDLKKTYNLSINKTIENINKQNQITKQTLKCSNRNSQTIEGSKFSGLRT